MPAEEVDTLLFLNRLSKINGIYKRDKKMDGNHVSMELDTGVPSVVISKRNTFCKEVNYLEETDCQFFSYP